MLKKIVYAVFILLVVLVSTELGLRLSGNYKTYSEKTTGEYTMEYGQESTNLYHLNTSNARYLLDHGEFNYEFRINDIGLRERPLPTDDDLTRKVFVFGDSFTEGVGAPYDSTWARHLERLLNRDLGNSGVFVCGVSGADPFFNHVLFQNLMRWRPTHVIFAVNSSDLTDYAIRGGFQRYEKKEKMVVFNDPPRFNKWYRRSHLVRFTAIELMGYDHNLIRKKDWPAIASEAVDSISDCLWWTQVVCRDNHTNFMTVIHPTPHEVCTGTDKTYMDEFFGIDDKVNTIFLAERMSSVMKGDDCNSYSWPVDGHYNSKGYEVMAKAIYEGVNEKYPGFW